MGSRIGCHVALVEPVDRVVCLGYPLQSGSTGALRDEVLVALQTPILFVQGTRDPLCALDRLAEVRARMAAPNALHVVEGGNHSLEASAKQRRAAGQSQDDVDRAILEVIRRFVEEPPARRQDYRIVTELGGGGMGTVYFAEHTVIGRRAAIKVLNRDVSANEDIVARFFTEAKAVNSIRHPNIVDITDFGQAGRSTSSSWRCWRGRRWARAWSARTLDERTTVRILGQVASAVGAVNEQGIVHRDLKPENIFLTNHPDYPDFVKVLDFGVVKLMGAPAGRRTRPSPGRRSGRRRTCRPSSAWATRASITAATSTRWASSPTRC